MSGEWNGSGRNFGGVFGELFGPTGPHSKRRSKAHVTNPNGRLQQSRQHCIDHQSRKSIAKCFVHVLTFFTVVVSTLFNRSVLAGYLLPGRRDQAAGGHGFYLTSALVFTAVSYFPRTLSQLHS